MKRVVQLCFAVLVVYGAWIFVTGCYELADSLVKRLQP